VTIRFFQFYSVTSANAHPFDHKLIGEIIMALIKKLEKIEKQRNSVHDEVEGAYTIFTDSKGNKILQIDTYGSTNRQLKGKVSQSIQLSKESAKELLNIILNQLLV
jgi:hypothetical protein